MVGYRTSRFHKILTVVSLCTVLILSGIVIFGLTNENTIELKEGNNRFVYIDGMYLAIEDEIEIRNGFNTNIDNLKVCVSLYDTKYDRTMTLWNYDSINLPSKETVLIPVKIRVSAFSVAAALIDSIKVEGSEIKLHVDTSGTYVYGLFDMDAEFDITYPLSDDGKTVSYDVTENTDNRYVLEVSNLRKDLVPSDRQIIITTIDTEMSVGLYNSEESFSIILESESGLSDALEKLKAGNSTVIGMGDTSEETKDALFELISALLYLRWVI